MPPLVTAVIPTYNHGKCVCDAIESVLRQSYGNVEVIVVDDGSADGTKEALGKYGGKIKYIYQNNRGLSAARNMGIRESKAEYVAFLDADDMWLPEKLERQMKYFDDLNIGLVGCGYINFDDDGNIIRTARGNQFKNSKDLAERLIIRNVISGSGSGVVARRECFKKAGMFDESLTASEDWDMWLRISMEYGVAIIEEPLTKIRITGNSMSSEGNAERMLRNALAVLGKVFKDNKNDYGWFLRKKAYSDRYFFAANASLTSGNKAAALRYLFISAVMNPLYFISRIETLILLPIIIARIIGSGAKSAGKPGQ
ncbi:MAG TPA: glycosyltransferase family 2 protein [Elusimicrobia bacterium]|nr:MAG: hypothetical protein A2278_05645 [Elusimicrobia bacterium RIFOXYA12_FULL_49_49]OGS11352.1 MAG: hypothetical protein A2386_07745 [Elusimicrobia bacterium RIFOXYB1_FULL_48_9]OGS15391.1 MAG: hypothetical protein A2251_07475 [Elusimicrobia bacterium RIFOXYA2_FULL_47_53]OGS26269.1 MAG: hypothetical protein A2339_01585 [Elusimicrobia bacterium RIFOXYB12_FULL_50_12]OGS30819.1 MAG: hypothetical protein A2323_00615 [Elusimicrobia bacterium RIFOXYB2_FULL_46_23]HBU69105.1 glycosyltransferase fami